MLLVNFVVVPVVAVDLFEGFKELVERFAGRIFKASMKSLFDHRSPSSTFWFRRDASFYKVSICASVLCSSWRRWARSFSSLRPG